MRVLSLFSGIGGLELGLERAGMTTIGQVEIDAFCRGVLAKHWPGVPRHDDVRTAPAWWRSAPRPAVDLVCGGFPCQPFSHAGKQLGTADERWGWPWMLDMIREVSPRYVLIENVPGLLSDTEAFATILADLSRLGFDAEWSIHSACQMGAPHVRKRLFTVAYANGEYGAQGMGRDQYPDPAIRAKHWGASNAMDSGERTLGAERGIDRVAHGIPGRVDRVRALGNAVVPQVAEFVGRMILERAEAA